MTTLAIYNKSNELYNVEVVHATKNLSVHTTIYDAATDIELNNEFPIYTVTYTKTGRAVYAGFECLAYAQEWADKFDSFFDGIPDVGTDEFVQWLTAHESEIEGLLLSAQHWGLQYDEWYWKQYLGDEYDEMKALTTPHEPTKARDDER